MAFNAGAIVSKLKLDTTNFSKGVKGAKGEAKGLGGFMQKNAAQFKKAGMAMTIAGAAIVASFGAMIKKASDAQEITAKFGTVFKDVFEDADKAAKNLAISYGLSSVAAKDMLGATGDLLTGLGLSGKAALTLSEQTQQLAVDLASFTNFAGGAKGASDALTKAMLGERESVKALGIVITEEMVKEELLRKGKEKLTGQAKLQAKAEATLTIAMTQSKNAIGDYARTQTSFANVTRTLKARMEDLVATLGTHLIPIATDLAIKIKGIVTRISDWIQKNPKLTGLIVKIGAAIGALMLVLGPLAMILPGLVSGFTLMLPVLAAIAPVVAVLATAFAAWKIGKKIGEITGFNKAVQGLLVSEYGVVAATDEAVAASRKLSTEYKLRDGEILKLKRTYGGFKEALKAVENGEVDLTGKTRKLKKEEEDLSEATKGLTTESGKLIEKLEFIVPASMQLAREFAAGKISILEYTTGMRNLRLEAERIADPYANLELALESSDDAFSDWGESTEGTMGSVLDSVGLWNQGTQAAYDENAEKAEQTAAAATAAWEEQNRHWLNLIGNMSGAFGNAVEGVLSGSVSLKEGLAGIWTDIKSSFFSMVGDMAAEWAITFLKNTLLDLTTKAAKEAGASIVSNLGGAITEAGSALGGVAEGIAGAVVSLAKGIASAAKIIAGSAKEILIAAAVVAAIYAGFKLIGKIFGGGGKSTGAQEYAVKLLEDIAWILLPALNEKTDETNRILVSFYGKYDAMLSHLIKIKAATQGTLKALTSQGTVYVDVFRSAVFENVGEKMVAGVATFGEEQEKMKEEYGKKSDEIIKQLDLLEKQTAVELKELQTQLVNAEGEERQKLQAKMEQLQKESQQKRAELINQLKILETEQKKAIEDMSKNITTGIDDLSDTVSGGMADLAGGLGEIGKGIRDIDFNERGIIDAIKKGRGGRPDIEAQHGALITEPTLAMVGEDAPRVPEIIAPVPAIASLMQAGGKSVHVTINIPNQLDPYAADKITRETIIPAIHRSLDSNYKLNDWQNKLRMNSG